ncbi:hypothetical protein GCM10010191_73450 [Actinomadura vinacea]|uniref:Cupin domain-containing protein n=1 Tax=Actinomadura vinacea TaxID=115336 RepID=A0ABN3K3L6_9ACTN
MQLAVTQNERELRDQAVARILSLDVAEHDALCSKDPEVAALRPLMRDLIPADFPGVTRWFLPVAPEMPEAGAGRFAAYLSRLEAGATVSASGPVRSAYVLKVVLTGAVRFEGRTLTAGDWLWVPTDRPYAFTAGDLGAVLFSALPCVAPEPDASDGAGPALDGLGTSLLSRAARGFVTSRDPGVDAAVRDLAGLGRATGLGDFAERADGVAHRFLPFAPPMPQAPRGSGRFFVWQSLLEPGTRVPRHSHELERLADYKVVISGSLLCAGRELTAGDWLWAPAGESYEFTAGETGALLVAGWPYN